MGALLSLADQVDVSNHLSPLCACRRLPTMFANKKLFTTTLLGVLVTLSIIALVLSLVKIEDVALPPMVKVRP